MTATPEHAERAHHENDEDAGRLQGTAGALGGMPAKRPRAAPDPHIGKRGKPDLGRLEHVKIAAFLVLYAVSFVIQAVLTSANPLSGVVAQFQVIISVFLVVSIPRLGYFVALGANAACLLALASRYLFLRDLPVLPGVFISLSTMITLTIVSLYARRLSQQNSVLARSRQELSRLYQKVFLAEQSAAYQANHDELTGLPNARNLRARLAQHYASARPAPPNGGLALIKVENLKGINSIFGSQAGDAVVQEVARRLLGYAEQNGCHAGRMQSGTFALFFPHSGPMERQLREVSERLKLHMGEGESSPNVQVCAGYARCGNGADNAAALYQCAEFALTYSKEADYQQVRGYDVDMEKAVRRHLTIVSELENALARNEFILFYQPKIDARNDRLIGAEALIRWKNARLGNVAPVEFIPLAEQNRLILGVGRWVLDRACQDASRWPEPWTVSVNVSTAQFFDPTFELQVASALANSGLAPSRLIVEVTESVLIEDADHVAGILNRIRAQDVAVSMDDFGTGFSSLAYLRNIPLDELKIDRSFVSTLETDEKSKTIVDTIVHLARQLNIRTVAEGVETRDQARILQQSGCDTLQGYLYGRPMPVAELLSLAADARAPEESADSTVPRPAPKGEALAAG